MNLVRGWRSGHIATYEQITAVVLALVAAFLIGAYVINPAKEAGDHVAGPIGRDLGILSSPCPSGWDLDTAASQDARVQSCSKGTWRVWLDDKGEFDHAWDGKSPDFVYVTSEVPGWK